MRRLGLRTRLVAGATAFAAVAIAVALVAAHLAIGMELRAATERLAVGDLAPYLSEIQTQRDEAPDDPPAGQLIGYRDATGAMLVDTLPAAVKRALDDHEGESTFRVRQGDDSWVVVSRRVIDTDGTVTLWAARSDAGTDEASDGIDRAFLLGGLGLVALFALASAVFTRAALRPLERQRERERRFVSDAAHELRTPIAGLSAQLALARRALGEGADADAELARAESSARRLGDLAANLLELARADERTSTPSAPLEALRAAFLDTVDDVRVSPPASGVDLDHVEEDLGGEGTAGIDAVSFSRVVRNLLSNAVVATGPGGSVRAALSREADELVLLVEDDGPGMGADFLPRARERFAREHPADGQGSGLGLALVDALTRAAGGTLTLENGSPGLRVEVRLPLAPEGR